MVDVGVQVPPDTEVGVLVGVFVAAPTVGVRVGVLVGPPTVGVRVSVAVGAGVLVLVAVRTGVGVFVGFVPPLTPAPCRIAVKAV